MYGVGSSSSLNTSSLPTPTSGHTPSPAGPNTVTAWSSLIVNCQFRLETSKSWAEMYSPDPPELACTLIHQSSVAGS